ncbi:MAG: hycD [Labilithrix sp.]|nr:hycD [Labilithrix sp.]
MTTFLVLHIVVLLALPTFVVGTINRTKALWSGRCGPPFAQLVFDIVRLVRKRAVYSRVTTPVFRLTPWLGLATAFAAGLVVPVLGGAAPVRFPFDFVAFAYVWGLGRVALMLGALDTGSAFEGMGASREASFAALLEPAFFLVAGAACLLTNERSFAAVLELRPTDAVHGVAWVASIVALFVVVQVESARMPVDDPTTHLELTMVHEVMILDHSGPDLAALYAGAAMKLTVGLSLVAALVNPAAGRAGPLMTAAINVVLTLALAIVVGTVESLVARLKMRAVPQYIMAGIIAAGVALLSTTFGMGVPR